MLILKFPTGSEKAGMLMPSQRGSKNKGKSKKEKKRKIGKKEKENRKQETGNRKQETGIKGESRR